MNDFTKMIYVVEGRRWWGFTDDQWIAFFPSALAGVRSGAGYKLPKKNRLQGRPACARRIDGEDAWESDRHDAEIFYLLDWDLNAWEGESSIMGEAGFLERGARLAQA